MSIHSSGTLIANRYEVVQGPLEKHSLAGGMGLVYLCVDHGDDGRPVALKTFKPEYLPNRAARDLFLREGTTWMDLGFHPHIVRCYKVIHLDVGLDVYLVLELVAADEDKDNASLRAWLTPDKSLPGKRLPPKPLPVEQALLFALHIARGMKHATTKIPGLVHRDLKPENVLIGRDRNARVTDFGLAEVLRVQIGAPIRLPPEQDPLGTPEYMAPEQWERWDVDMRADIYALGCILVEMLTGHVPVKAEPRTACRQLHQSGHALKAARGLPEVLQPLLTRCLAVNAEERYANWLEVEVALADAYKTARGKAVPAEICGAEETYAERVAAGWSLSAIGAAYRDIGKPGVAVEYFERVVRIGQAEKERVLEGAGLGNMATAYRHLGDVGRAIELSEKALAIVRESGDRVSEGCALGNLGIAYRNLGDARRAIQFFDQTLAVAREIGDKAMEARSLGNLGNAYASLRDTRRAIGLSDQALAIAQEIGDRAMEGSILGNLGTAYIILGDAQRVIDFAGRHLAIARQMGDRAGEGNALGNLGNAYQISGDAVRAIEFFEQNLAILREIGDLKTATERSLNLAKLLVEQDQSAKALGHAEYAAQAFAQAGHAQEAKTAQHLVALLRTLRALGE